MAPCSLPGPLSGSLSWWGVVGGLILAHAGQGSQGLRPVIPSGPRLLRGAGVGSGIRDISALGSSFFPMKLRPC